MCISGPREALDPRGGGVLPYKRLIGMGLHFHDWSDYNGVAFSIEWGRKFLDFWSK